MTVTTTKTTPAPATLTTGLVAAVLLVAANLRATLTEVGTLLPDIERATGLAASWGGVVGTLPLLTFAVTSPFVGRISHRFGSARVLVVALAVLAVGTIVRSLQRCIRPRCRRSARSLRLGLDGEVDAETGYVEPRLIALVHDAGRTGSPRRPSWTTC